MALRLAQRVIEHLSQHAGERFSARDLAVWVHQTYPVECADKAKSAGLSEATLLQQLVSEIGSQLPAAKRRHPELHISDTRPRRYCWNA